MVKKIIKFPNSSLRSMCKEVDFTKADRQFLLDHIQDLKDTLDNTPNGIALASNQIESLGYCVFVVKPDAGLPDVFINPSWMPALEDTGRIEMSEGCLSIPELYTTAMRYPIVTVAYFDIDGNEHALHNVEGLAAQIIQHECEHLKGGSLTDHITHKQLIRLRAEAIRNRKAGR